MAAAQAAQVFGGADDPSDPIEMEAAQARRRFALAFDAQVFVQALRDAYPEFETAPAPPDPIALYLSRPEFARLNANPLFEEAWYRRTYPDVAQAVAEGRHPSGLHPLRRLGVCGGAISKLRPARPRRA